MVGIRLSVLMLICIGCAGMVLDDTGVGDAEEARERQVQLSDICTDERAIIKFLPPSERASYYAVCGSCSQSSAVTQVRRLLRSAKEVCLANPDAILPTQAGAVAIRPGSPERSQLWIACYDRASGTTVLHYTRPDLRGSRSDPESELELYREARDRARDRVIARALAAGSDPNAELERVITAGLDTDLDLDLKDLGPDLASAWRFVAPEFSNMLLPECEFADPGKEIINDWYSYDPQVLRTHPFLGVEYVRLAQRLLDRVMLYTSSKMWIKHLLHERGKDCEDIIRIVRVFTKETFDKLRALMEEDRAAHEKLRSDLQAEATVLAWREAHPTIPGLTAKQIRRVLMNRD